LYANVELRATTERWRFAESPVIRSSVMPSARKSCSLESDRFVNGRTASGGDKPSLGACARVGAPVAFGARSPGSRVRHPSTRCQPIESPVSTTPASTISAAVPEISVSCPEIQPVSAEKSSMRR